MTFFNLSPEEKAFVLAAIGIKVKKDKEEASRIKAKK
jgi:hypothetical protein